MTEMLKWEFTTWTHLWKELRVVGKSKQPVSYSLILKTASEKQWYSASPSPTTTLVDCSPSINNAVYVLSPIGQAPHCLTLQTFNTKLAVKAQLRLEFIKTNFRAGLQVHSGLCRAGRPGGREFESHARRLFCCFCGFMPFHARKLSLQGKFGIATLTSAGKLSSSIQ